jgi:transcriptional regulator with XRE-family HTH domain
MLDNVKSAEILKKIGETLHAARINYKGSEGKKRSLGKPGISMRDLAKAAGVQHMQVSAIEKGRANATILTLIAIADVLDVDLSDLMKNKSARKKGR